MSVIIHERAEELFFEQIKALCGIYIIKDFRKGTFSLRLEK